MKDTRLLKSLFEIFKYQLPVELHENAMYTMLNVVMEAKKPEKEYLMSQDFLHYFKIFMEDTHDLDFNVLREG